MKKYLLLAILLPWVALNAQSESVIADGATVLVSGKNATSCFMYADASSAKILSSSDTKDWTFVWTLKHVADKDDDVFYLYNEFTDLYVGKTGEAESTDLTAVSSTDDAGMYKIELQDNTYYSFTDIDKDSDSDIRNLNLGGEGSVKNYYLYNGTNLRPNSLFTVTDASSEAAALTNVTLAYYNSKVGEYIGDRVATEDMQTTYADLSKEAHFATALNLALAVKNAEINKPIAGHYYQIISAYPWYANELGYISETYYNQDYHPNTGSQRLHFLKMEEGATTIMVPTFWQFEEADNGLGYRIKAANSGKYWRGTGTNTMITALNEGNSGIGYYEILPDHEFVVYDHAVALRGTVHDDTDRTNTVGIFEATDQDVHDWDVRDGSSKIEATDDEITISQSYGPNNWRITEATELELYFPHDPNIENENNDGNISLDTNTETESFRTIYLPFAVSVPDKVKAYSVIDSESTDYEDSRFSLKRITTMHNDSYIIPANTPAVLIAESVGTYTFNILYDNNEEAIESDLYGTLEPYPVADKTIIYVIDDPQGYTSHAVMRVGGTDYSYNQDEVYKTSGASTLSIYGNSATYILQNNRAFLKYKGYPKNTDDNTTELKEKPMTVVDDGVTGIEEIKVDNTIEKDNSRMLYYDIYGRRITNPQKGLYIREDGTKILIR